MFFKRVLSLLLAGLLLWLTLPFAVFALGGSRAEATWSHNGKIDGAGELLAGGLRGRKTAISTENANEYLIEIEIDSRAEPTTQGSTILFLVDVSRNGGLVEYQKILREVIPAILADESPHQIGVAIFNDSVTMLQDFSDYSGKDQLLAQIDGLTESGGNYIEAGIRQGREWLVEQGGEDLHLVVLSKGYATYSSKVKRVVTTAVCDGTHLDQDIQWNIDPVYMEPKEIIGTGVGENAGIALHRVEVGSVVCNLGKAHPYQPNSGKYPYIHIDNALYESELTKAEGIAVHIVSHAPTERGEKVLKQMQSEGLFTNMQTAIESLKDAFAPPSSEEVALLLKEQVNPWGAIVEGSLRTTGGETTIESDTILWEMDHGGKLSYRLVWSVDKPDFPNKTVLATGVETTVTMADETLELIQPYGIGFYHQVYVQGVWVNDRLELLDENGAVVSGTDQGVLIAERKPVLNPLGVNQWKPQSIIDLQADRLNAREGYRLHPEAPENYLLRLDGEVENPLISFLYVDNRLSYKIDYKMSGEIDPFAGTKITEVPFGTIITNVPDHPNRPTGAVRMGAEGLPFTVVDHASLVTITYQNPIPVPTPLEYTIHYYLDGEQVEGKTLSQFVMSDAPTLQLSAYLQWDDEQGDPYVLKKVLFNGEKITETEVVITEERKQINLYFESVEEETPEPPDPSTYSLIIDYYYLDQQGALLDQQTDDTLVFLTPIEYDFQMKKMAHVTGGFGFLKTVFNGSTITGDRAFLSEHENILQLYYEKTEENAPSLDIYVDVYYDDVKFSGKDYRLAGNKQFPASLSAENRHPSQFDFYQLSHMETEDGTIFTGTVSVDEIVSRGFVLRICYEGARDNRLPYIVQYHLPEGTVLSTEHEVTIGELADGLYPKVDAEDIEADSQFAGYNVDKIVFGNREHPTVLAERITWWENTFHVYLKSAQVEDSYSFTVEYYYDDVKDDTLTEVVFMDELTAQVSSVPLKEHSGYDHQTTLPILPATIGNGETIRVYHVADQPTTEPPEPRPEPSDRAITVEYLFQGGEGEATWRESLLLKDEQAVYLWDLLGNKEYEEKLFTLDRVIVERKRRETQSAPVSLGESSGGRTTRSQWNEFEVVKGAEFTFYGEYDYRIRGEYKLSSVVVDPPKEPSTGGDTTPNGAASPASSGGSSKGETKEQTDTSTPPPQKGTVVASTKVPEPLTVKQEEGVFPVGLKGADINRTLPRTGQRPSGINELYYYIHILIRYCLMAHYGSSGFLKEKGLPIFHKRSR